MSNHTPGPWSRRGTAIIDAKGRPIAEMRGLQRELPEHVANATLIAVVPDLLDACRALATHANDLADYYCNRKGDDEIDINHTMEGLERALQMAGAAIAAATGQQE